MVTIPFSDLAACLPPTVQEKMTYVTHHNERKTGRFCLPKPQANNSRLFSVIGECCKSDHRDHQGARVLAVALVPFGTSAERTINDLARPQDVWARIGISKTGATVSIWHATSDTGTGTLALFDGQATAEGDGLIRITDLPHQSEQKLSGTVVPDTGRFDEQPTPELDVTRAFFDCLKAISNACQTGAPVDPAAVAALKAVKKAMPLKK